MLQGKKLVLAISGGVIAVIIFIGLILSIKTVPANHVGVKYSPFSGVSNSTLNSGFHVLSPFDKVYNISTEVQSATLTELTGQTSDAQFLKIEIDVKYQVNRQDVFKVFQQFRTLDQLNRVYLRPVAQRAIEQVLTQYNIMDILGEKRNEVYDKIKENLSNSFNEASLQLYSFSILDTDAGEEIESAIKRESIAKKDAETAKQNLEKEKIEAEIKKTKAQAEADANAILSEKIDDKILKKMEMEARIKHGWITVQGAQGTVVQP